MERVLKPVYSTISSGISSTSPPSARFIWYAMMECPIIDQMRKNQYTLRTLFRSYLFKCLESAAIWARVVLCVILKR